MKRKIFVAVPVLVLLSILSYPVLVVTVASYSPEYSHARDFISELSAPGAPQGWVLRAALLVDAVVLGVFAVLMHRLVAKNRRASLGPIAIGIFAFSLFLGGAFPCDADCRPGTFSGWIHVLNAVPSLFATLAGPFLIWRRLSLDPRWAGYDTFAFVCGVLTFGAVLYSMTLLPAYEFTGLGQRLVLAFQLLFYAGLAVGALRFGITSRVDRFNPSASEAIA